MVGRAKVVKAIVTDAHRLGLFVDAGLDRFILLPGSELPPERGLWPHKGEVVWVKIVTDRKRQQLARRAKREEMEALAQPAEGLRRGLAVEGAVYHAFTEGALVMLDQGVIGFIHHSETQSELHVGQRIKARITFVREDGHVNLSLRPSKARARDEDARLLLRHLQERGGAMPYTDRTDAAVLWQRFRLSKASFKRALGKLLKEGHISQEGDWTYLKEPRDRQSRAGEE